MHEEFSSHVNGTNRMANRVEYRELRRRGKVQQIKEDVVGSMHGVLFPGQSVTQE